MSTSGVELRVPAAVGTGRAGVRLTPRTVTRAMTSTNVVSRVLSARVARGNVGCRCGVARRQGPYVSLVPEPMGGLPMTDAPQPRRRDPPEVVPPLRRRPRWTFASIALPVGLALMVAAG